MSTSQAVLARLNVPGSSDLLFMLHYQFCLAFGHRPPVPLSLGRQVHVLNATWVLYQEVVLFNIELIFWLPSSETISVL